MGFALFIFILIMIFQPELKFIFLIPVILVLVLLLVAIFKKQPEPEQSEVSHYKIGTEVSSHFYDEVKQYCRKHHMTISDLIRKSVRAYMDSNK